MGPRADRERKESLRWIWGLRNQLDDDGDDDDVGPNDHGIFPLIIMYPTVARTIASRLEMLSAMHSAEPLRLVLL